MNLTQAEQALREFLGEYEQALDLEIEECVTNLDSGEGENGAPIDAVFDLLARTEKLSGCLSMVLCRISSKHERLLHDSINR